MKFLFLYLMIISSLSASLTNHQIKTLQKVIDISKQYHDYLGESYPKTLAAICMTESSANKNKKPEVTDIIDNSGDIVKGSLGLMQVRVLTARHVAKIYKIKGILNLSDRELAKKLLHNQDLNIRIANLYFINQKNFYKKYFVAISRYNGGSKNYTYVNKVLKNLKLINKLVDNGKLRL